MEFVSLDTDCWNVLFMESINVKEIIDFYYPNDNELKNIYNIHAEKVASMALEMARRHPELGIDMQFVEEAAMLHDLGIFLTDAPRIYCFGTGISIVYLPLYRKQLS